DDREASRRSIYVYVKRNLAVPELDLLDTPDTTSSCEMRQTSTTGPQALTLLNGEFMVQQAKHFAARLEREAGTDSEKQIRHAFLLTMCRPPQAEELQAALAFLAKQRRLIEKEDEQAEVSSVDLDRKSLEALCLVLL